MVPILWPLKHWRCFQLNAEMFIPILHPEASSLSAAPATSTETQKQKNAFRFFFFPSPLFLACAERPRPPIKNSKQFHLPTKLWGNTTDMRVIIYRFRHKKFFKKNDALWHKFSPWTAVKAWLRLTNYDLPKNIKRQTSMCVMSCGLQTKVTLQSTVGALEKMSRFMWKIRLPKKQTPKLPWKWDAWCEKLRSSTTLVFVYTVIITRGESGGIYTNNADFK